MAKRTVAAVLAWSLLFVGQAGADEHPKWPCEVAVSIDPGPNHDAAVVAVGQLDDATVISWPVVDEGGMVRVSWRHPAPFAALATVWGTDTDLTAATVEVDPAVPGRWVMVTLLHEFGHVAGLEHNGEERSVMNATSVPWRRFQTVDLEALGKIECRHDVGVR